MYHTIERSVWEHVHGAWVTLLPANKLTGGVYVNNDDVIGKTYTTHSLSHCYITHTVLCRVNVLPEGKGAEGEEGEGLQPSLLYSHSLLEELQEGEGGVVPGSGVEVQEFEVDPLELAPS